MESRLKIILLHRQLEPGFVPGFVCLQQLSSPGRAVQKGIDARLTDALLGLG
jgi:hypothetical protein